MEEYTFASNIQKENLENFLGFSLLKRGGGGAWSIGHKDEIKNGKNIENSGGVLGENISLLV